MTRKCPDDCALIRLAVGETSPRETDLVLRHLAVCSRCAARFNVLRQLKRDLGPRVDAFVSDHGPALAAGAPSSAPSHVSSSVPARSARPLRPRPLATLASLRWAPVLALVAVVFGTGAFLAVSRAARHSDLRSPSSKLTLLSPAGSVPAPPAVLRWSPVLKAEGYVVEVIDDSLDRIHTGSAFFVNELVLPPAVRDRLVKGRVYLWTVTARDKDSNLLTSGSASFVVE